MGPPRQEPYARYRIRQYEGGEAKRGGREDHPPDEVYEDVRAARRQPSVRKSSMQTTVTSFGEGLRRPSQLFGSLKKAGQRFVGAEHLQGSLSSIHRLAGRTSRCQCRHHQNKLISGKEETKELEKHVVKTDEKSENKKQGHPPNRAFLEAKKVFRGDDGAIGNYGSYIIK